MKKYLLYFKAFLAILLLGGPASGWAQTRFFVEAPDLKEVTRAEKNVSAYRVYRLDVAALRAYLANAPVEFTADSRPALRLAVPLPNGTSETFAIYDSPILAPAVAAQYPNIKTYTGQTQTAGSTAVIRFSFTGDEFNAIVLGLPGAGTAYFEKSTVAPGANVYLSYSTLDVLPATGRRATKKNPCGVQPLSRPINVGGINRGATSALRTGGTLRTLRLAITATGEFTNAKGTPNNTAAGGYAAVVQYVNRLVAVYRRELSVSFVLVSTASVVYPDPATDPFLTPTNSSTVLPVSQSVLDTNVGDANYDIGHALGYGGASSGGGLAQSSSVCTTGSKAQAVSDVNEGGPGQFPAVFGDQVFCHEVGHQVGMSHSYNSSIPVCTTRNADTSMEPGSGTTIMSYGYTCADAVDPAKNDDYETGYLPFLNFHAVNLAEATAFLGTISCYTTTNTGNSVPVITAFTTGRTIPKSTPFALTGTATDADAGNVLSYSWEGMDAGAPAATPPGPTVLGDPAQAPFFRSYEPAATITRVFPRLASILDGTNQAKGDKLPSVGRVVNLRLTVRDNVDGANEASSAITIDGNSGPFLITSNLAGSYPGNTPQTVTWSVNNTTAAPVSCANVDILLSTDGGLTFPITLLTATPNDGTEPVTMPVLPAATTTARIKVQASNNIFFDISNANFSITSPLNTVGAGPIAGSPFCTGTAVSVPYSANGTFAAGNTFEAQLSDAAGGFGTPVAIGSVSSVAASGTIAAVIPTGTAAGTGYRIRVVASNPATPGADNGANLTISAPAVATFSYGPTNAFCTSQTATQAAVAGSGATSGSFSVSPATGLTFDAMTGTITPSTSTPGTYTVTNTVAAGGGCAAVTATTTVSIAAPQTAGFNYGPTNAFCTSQTATQAAVAGSGATLGSFSVSPATGLTLDAMMGTITPSTSTPGTYTVTNTVAAGGGCAAVTATTTVSIAAPQTAGFNYGPTNAFCTSQTATQAAVAGSGATLGSFSVSPATGLTLDAMMGTITPSTSTPGTYTVTNTVAAAGGCAAVTATTTVSIAAPQTAGFSYAAVSYCTSATGPVAAGLATGATAGTFTSTTGLTLNAATGAITPSTSTPGTYTVTNTVAPSGGCAAVTATTTVSIAAPQTAGFSYAAASYCTSATGPVAAGLATGATAGTFTSTTGLTLNAATGAITPSTSTPGTYTVTNMVAASGGCAAVTATTTVSIAAPQTAGFSYAVASYCTSQTAAQAAVAGSGATLGTFTVSPTGLTLNAATGAITPSTSTPGTYTVTNTVAASGGCAAVTATTTVSIAAPQTAGFSYAVASYCTSQTAAQAAVAGSGATLGTFTVSPTGLTLNAATGAITPSTSTPGTYTVTNTVAASGGCAAVTATTTVSIAAPQTAGFSYAAASYCTSQTAAQAAVAGSGATLGTFTVSPTGLTLNAATGAITPSTSTPGTYTVTNMVAASGGCAAVTATTTVSIAAPQTAGFSYAVASYCTSQTAAQAAVAGSGATLGTFTVSPTGLTLNAATGAITPSTSTPGTYTVTNMVAASGGCAAVTATTTVSIAAPQTAGFSYAVASYCTSQTAAQAAVAGSGATLGTFTVSPTGLTLNAATGAITPSTSTPGTYTVTNMVAASGGCAAVTATTTVSIAAPQTAGFSYAVASYCTSQTAAQAAVFGSGATLGTFTVSPTGLTLNAATGAITPSTSTPGTYTVTNTVAASGGCAAVTATTTVSIAAPQTAGFSYAAASYCTSQTAAQAAVAGSGATLGTFTVSPTGLTLNAATGAITPSTSTPGTYTVTNTVAASGGCAAVTATTTVSIAAPQSATFTYPASSASYCAGAAGPLTPTMDAGAMTGTFTLVNGTSTGATINPTTGVVNVSAATAGTFTVSNTLAASGGCATVVANQTLTVLPLPATPVLIAAGANTVAVQGGAVAGLIYQFRRNGVAVGTASAVASYQVTNAAGNGQYTVVATSAAGCSSAPSAAVPVAFVTGTLAQAAPVTLLLYPNPAPLGGGATVELQGWTGGPATLTLYDVLGRTMRVTPAASGGTTHLDLSGLATGVYLLRAQAPGQQVSRRLVVE